jgi:CubicO group peptidase (beta-lactamase class C family)
MNVAKLPIATMEALGTVADWPTERAGVAVARFDPGGVATDRRTVAVIGVTGEDDRPFAWASVTKPATALAVLVAVEEGTLSLDEPAGPPGSTVRHLLAHASGLGPDGGSVLAAPGQRRIYSNAGYALLGEVLARRSGLPFAEYLAQGVLDPLGMTGTSLGGRAQVIGDTARLGDEGTADPAAAGLVGPLVDLVALGSEWAVPSLVSPETHRSAISVQYPTASGVLPGFGRFDPCGWGLGVEVRGHKRPHWTGTANSPETYGHFGRSGSFLWVDPVAGVFCAGLGDRAFGPWAAEAWPALADAVLAEAGFAGPAGIPFSGTGA